MMKYFNLDMAFEEAKKKYNELLFAFQPDKFIDNEQLFEYNSKITREIIEEYNLFLAIKSELEKKDKEQYIVSRDNATNNNTKNLGDILLLLIDNQEEVINYALKTKKLLNSIYHVFKSL